MTSAILGPVCGKLMLAGEYSVLLPDGVALAATVGTDLRVHVSASLEDICTSEALGLSGESLSHPQLQFVRAGLEAVRSATRITRPLHVGIAGSMWQRGTAKVGLGSSAATVVGTVVAAWHAYTGALPSEDAAFRLAHWAHSQAQGKLGSGYDVASIAAAWLGQKIGHAVLYAPPHVERIQATAMPLGPSDCWLLEPWPECRIEVLPWPSGLRAWAVWSGQSANTRELVRAAAPSLNAPELAAMRACAVELGDCWARGEVERILIATENAEGALEVWDSLAGGRLLQGSVNHTKARIRSVGAVARTSGAGGGDTVLALAGPFTSLDNAELEAAIQSGEWAEITPLGL